MRVPLRLTATRGRTAFSVFFTQSPSFLQHQRLMKQKKGQDHAKSLFGLSEIPCDNQIRNLLEPISAKTVFDTFKTVYEWLKKHRIIERIQFYFCCQSIIS